jgi:carboxymethylenebutenolidase
MDDHTRVVPSPDGPVPVYEAKPAGPVRGGALVIQEAFGITDHIASVADRFAAAGYHAVAPHLFHRVGDPVLDYTDFAAAKPLLTSLTGAGMRNDAEAAISLLTAAGLKESQLAVVGFCMGGTASFFLATELPLGAAVTYYGGGVAEPRGWPGVRSLIELAPALRAPWLGPFGDQDRGIPVEQVERLREATAAAPVPTELIRYPEAGHGFNCDDRPSAFQPQAAARAWQATLDWLAQHLPA